MPAERAPSYPIVLALFATATYLALVVCAFGMTSLITDTEVVVHADAGPLLGPAATAAATVTVLLGLLGMGARYSRDVAAAKRASIGDPVRIGLGQTVLLGIAAVLVYVLAGGLLYAVATGEAFSLVLYAGETVLRPYALAVGVLAVAVSVVYALLLASGGEHPSRPLWPWER